ncbi:hypothetical protein tloyanaT_04280 [Thalassotalea loyana]|uniref:STAS/SEC14 domain-containing protein n=1 Tax=Thalassotalea loyana TaxID=280483 RepID=A0ABQ6H7Q7_9GAMM|nr:hypothetical protein [Thalassotalea loyana]GLX84176.1 hypothetical protein tloyanaT_04280 [Thalassotalea loyana]
MTNQPYKITAQDNILFVDASGPFDFDTMLEYKSETLDAIEKIKHKPWGCIACFHGSGVFSPEAEEELVALTKERMKKNMAALATVIQDSGQADIQQMQLSRVYESCNTKYHIFSDVNAAKAWLANYLKKQTN